MAEALAHGLLGGAGLPTALAVLAFGWWLIPRGGSGQAAVTGRAWHRFDIPGAVTSTAAMLVLVYMVVSAGQAGWGLGPHHTGVRPARSQPVGAARAAPGTVSGEDTVVTVLPIPVWGSHGTTRNVAL